MHQFAVIISLALVVDLNSVVKPHCGSPGTEAGLLEQLRCVSESIRLRAEELAEGEGAPYAERELAVKGESAKQPSRAEEILQIGMERVREAKKALERFERESRNTPAPKR